MQLEVLPPPCSYFPVALSLCGTGLLAFGALRGHGGARRAGLLVLVPGGGPGDPHPTSPARWPARPGGFLRLRAHLPLQDTHEDMGLASWASCWPWESCVGHHPGPGG